MSKRTEMRLWFFLCGVAAILLGMYMLWPRYRAVPLPATVTPTPTLAIAWTPTSSPPVPVVVTPTATVTSTTVPVIVTPTLIPTATLSPSPAPAATAISAATATATTPPPPYLPETGCVTGLATRHSAWAVVFESFPDRLDPAVDGYIATADQEQIGDIMLLEIGNRSYTVAVADTLSGDHVAILGWIVDIDYRIWFAQTPSLPDAPAEVTLCASSPP